MAGPSTRYKREKRAPRPLDAARLEELALSYVARFSTSAGKLRRYLERKLRERGWDAGDGEGHDDPLGDPFSEGGPDLDALIARYVERGYVDDAAYARAKAGDLLRRGYGGRRVRQALGQAGIGHSVAERVAPGVLAAREAALHMARKRRTGPYAMEPVERDIREKQVAAMLRAGHSFDIVRAVLDMRSEDEAREWLAEAAEDEDTDRWQD